MKHLIFAAFALCTLAPGWACTGEAGNGNAADPPVAPISAESLVDLRPAVGGSRSPQWAPDGSRITFVSPHGGIAALDVELGGVTTLVENVQLSGVGSLGAPQPTWSPDGRWIAYTSDKGGAPDIWLWSAEDGSDRRLTRLSARANGLAWSPDGRWIAFSGDRFGNMDIWKVSVPGGEVHRLTGEVLYEGYPSWAPDSERLYYVRMDDRWVDHDVIEINPDGTNPRVAVEDRGFFDYRAGRAFGSAQPSPDGRTLLFRSQRSGWLNFWVAPVQGGEPRQIAASDHDQSDARWSPDGRWISYTENRGGVHSLRVVPAEGGEPRVLADPRHQAPRCVRSGRRRGDRISYTVETPVRPAELFILDMESGESRLVHTEADSGRRRATPHARKGALPEHRRADHRSLPAPSPQDAAPGQRFPGVIWIHGGPTSQFDDQFRRHQQVHFFAQRGYVVLMPNIRGSSGYGLEFEDLNNGCWGHCDLEDVLAGVDYLKSLPDVDPDRIGVTGTSYGGIMTMAAVAFAPGVFQAAISLSGYGDMTDMFTKVHELQHIKLLEYELGPYPENRGRLPSQFSDPDGPPGHHAHLRDPGRRRRRRLAPARTRAPRGPGLRPEARSALQDRAVQGLPGRGLLRVRAGQHDRKAARHAGLLRGVPGGWRSRTGRRVG